MADTDQKRRDGQPSASPRETPQAPLREQPQQPASVVSGRPPAAGGPASATGAAAIAGTAPSGPGAHGSAALSGSPAPDRGSDRSKPGQSSAGSTTPGGNTASGKAANGAMGGSGEDSGGLRDKVEEDWEAMRKAAGSQFSRATDKVAQTADRQRGFAADQVSSVARAIDRAGSELESEDQRELGRVTRQLGDSVQRLADEMKGRSLSEMAAMAEDFGRRQPLAFLGLAAFAGLAASRFAGASASRQPSMEPRQTRAGGTRPQGETSGTVPTSATTQPSARPAAATGTTPGAHHG
ncbi:hypothetical protein [Rhizobium sp. CSW-27]|uniref:hypothetical protein n=1 Tax=Rhizobium sp. CSW-27 TaxID=2839985 RepID=UPI001C024858|nr:hypothetical protein [Rhizobium sp. CSW-27]MBT9371477.1 hypothetical protein [Rhizobium sp. CSW-27]